MILKCLVAILFKNKNVIYLFEHGEVICDHFLSKHTSHTPQKQRGKTETFLCLNCLWGIPFERA